MRLLCQCSLLGAFVGLGFAAFACLMGWYSQQQRLARFGLAAALFGFLLLSAGTLLLGAALVTKDFSFAYVAQYSSRRLPWHYSLSALWVGQAGSLLLWCWLTVLLASVYRFARSHTVDPIRDPTFGLLMLLSWFLVATTIFAVDPAAASLGRPEEGSGLSPLLQHPAMLIHPPVIFLGYAAWSIPMALSLSALWTGRLDEGWIHAARGWALFAWAVLGGGILLGANWAYGELGWGGYWGWDPVENGSLLPWLTGTALIHALMAWRHAGLLKGMAVALPIVTFAMCCFATFLTRSGIFSSVHAFSESPIGWLFLILMLLLLGSGTGLLVARRSALRPERKIACVLCRESMIAVSMLALILLTIVVCGGTLFTAVSKALIGRHLELGPAFYNHVLIPTGLLLLAVTSLAPLLRWSGPPTTSQTTMLRWSMLTALAGGGMSCLFGIRDPLRIAVVALATLAVAVLVLALWLDANRRPVRWWSGMLQSLRGNRRAYAGFLAHLGFFCLALGIMFSARGSRQREVELKVGQAVTWAGYTVRLCTLTEREEPDKLVAEARLDVTDPHGSQFTLQPAQHYHRLQREWTSEVAVDANWARDFYTILHGGADEQAVHLTLRINPMMRWLWTGGTVMVGAAVIGLVPSRAARRKVPPQGASPRPSRCRSTVPTRRKPWSRLAADRPGKRIEPVSITSTKGSDKVRNRNGHQGGAG